MPDPAAIRAALARAHARRDAAQAAVADLETALAEIEVDDAWPARLDDPDLVTVAQAASQFGRSPQTIRRWCDEGIGKHYGGQWRVSLRRARAKLNCMSVFEGCG